MLRIVDVSKTFSNGEKVLQHVSFEVEKGEFVAVLGPSGSGKSTLFKCINRLVEPTEGQIFVYESDILQLRGKRLAIARQKVGFIFQQYNLAQRITALSNVLAGRLAYVPTWRAIFRTFSSEDRHLGLHCLERVGLKNKAEQRADTLSGGQQQRVAVARALAQQPLLLLADEPVSSLDPQSATRVMDVLRSINKEEGITVVCSLHQVDLAMKYADRIIGLKEGKVISNQVVQSFDLNEREKIYS